MSIMVLDTTTNNTFTFPMLPEDIKFSAGSKFIKYDIMKTGDVSIPYGEELSQFSFSGTLPGASRASAPYIDVWMEPREIQELWSAWRYNGRKLKLTIDNTPIDHGVYLQTYDVKYSGGMGDYTYSIQFITAKDINLEIEKKEETGDGQQYIIITGSRVNIRTQPNTKGRILGTEPKGTKLKYLGNRAASGWYNVEYKGQKAWISNSYSKIDQSSTGKPGDDGGGSSRTYTVKKNDTLWRISQIYYGNGRQYTKIQKANNLKNTIIWPGMKLIIP